MSADIPEKARLAVLIDAENISAGRVGPLFKKVAEFGRATARRIYGDWTRPDMAQWRNVLHQHAIVPIQQFRMSKGKNCVDCALIVDAMDLLYTGRFDGFCIISSDSDFTRLAHRLRESGLVVYGFGEKTTPEAFVKSCDRFIVLGLLDPPSKSKAAPEPSVNGAAPDPPAAPAPRLELDETQLELIKAAYLGGAGEDGWVDMAFFGGEIRKLSPSFDPRALGFGKLGRFVESIGLFEVRKTPSAKNPPSSVWHIRWTGEIERPQG